MDYKYNEKDFLALIEEDDTVTYTTHTQVLGRLKSVAPIVAH